GEGRANRREERTGQAHVLLDELRHADPGAGLFGDRAHLVRRREHGVVADADSRKGFIRPLTRLARYPFVRLKLRAAGQQDGKEDQPHRRRAYSVATPPQASIGIEPPEEASCPPGSFRSFWFARHPCRWSSRAESRRAGSR